MSKKNTGRESWPLVLAIAEYRADGRMETGIGISWRKDLRGSIINNNANEEGAFAHGTGSRGQYIDHVTRILQSPAE